MVGCRTMQSRAPTGARAEELYLTAVPTPGDPPRRQARRLYTAVREALAAAGARILAERLFATREAMDVLQAERRSALGAFDDGVPPTRIVVSPGRTGAVAGVQVHAVAADRAPAPLRCGGIDARAAGRQLRIGADRWLTVSELSPASHGPPGEQARRMFDSAASVLREAGADMRAVVRTWLWLKDIGDWYAELNAVRTAFFRREGLIGNGNGRAGLPASTGIGLGSAAGAACALDLVALPGAEDRLVFLEAAGEQNAAFAYGSAFSRAAIAPMPGGRTLFVSGTAAIDAQGRTQHVGQIEAQIDDTVRQVRALLAEAGCADEHVLGALVYCKTPQVEEAFHSGWACLGWPAVSMIGDVCRPELLFEVELAAGPVADGGGKG
jgi:enamine deaminase RidA (YjgF/YER057c/UK114 family)